MPHSKQAPKEIVYSFFFVFAPGSIPNNTLRIALCFLPWHLTAAYFVGRPLHYEGQQPQAPVPPPPPAAAGQNAGNAQVPGAFLQLCSWLRKISSPELLIE